MEDEIKHKLISIVMGCIDYVRAANTTERARQAEEWAAIAITAASENNLPALDELSEEIG